MKTSRAYLLTGLLSLLTSMASAVPLKIAETNLDNSGSGTELTWAQSSITAFNLANGASLPALSELSGGTKQNGTDGKSWQFDLPDAFDFAYVLLKWGGGNSNPYSHQLFFVTGDELFSSPIYTKKNGKRVQEFQGGLSHLTIWTGSHPDETPRVPESGMAALWLTPVLVGMAMLRRRRS